MGLLEKLKSLFGSDDGHAPAGSTEANVTVERELAAESEHAVKGTDEGEAPETGHEDADEDEGTDEHDDTAVDAERKRKEAEPEEPEQETTDTETGDETEAPPAQEIDGIGPTYADRLETAGIETVADLAKADVGTVADATEAGESRAEDWIEQAGEY